jgi:hypothetical protein
MEKLAITDWHACAIYAVIYTNLICIDKLTEIGRCYGM